MKAAHTHARSLSWLLRGGRERPNAGFRILAYHRVAAERDELAVFPRRFRQQMRYLADQGYEVVDVAEIIHRLNAKEECGRTIGLSFDDGYRDIAEEALPTLEELGFRATVFVVTGAADGTVRFPWYEQQPALLSWPEIVELDQQGRLRFEPHTVTHPALTRLSAENAEKEIVLSKQVLERHLRRPTEVFCYPAGLYGAREVALAKAAGFIGAVTCEPGVNSLTHDRFVLRRTQIDARDTMLTFRAKLAGAHDRPSLARAAYRAIRYSSTTRRARS